MKKKVYIFDIDGTIVNSLIYFRSIVKIFEFICPILYVEPQKGKKIVCGFIWDCFQRINFKMEIFPGVKEFFEKIEDNSEIYFISCRREKHRKYTINQLKALLPKNFDFSSRLLLAPTKITWKDAKNFKVIEARKIIKQFFDSKIILIEDDPHLLNNLPNCPRIVKILYQHKKNNGTPLYPWFCSGVLICKTI